MRKFILVLLAVACFGLVGCGVRAGNDISALEAQTKYGELPGNYQQLVMEKIATRLIDPMSAQYEFYVPQPKESGWYGLVGVNAKNRFGGYAGRQLWEYRIENGQVVEFGENQNDVFLRSFNRRR